MTGAALPKCENCGDGALVETGNEDGDFVCENANDDDLVSGAGCGELVPAAKVRRARAPSLKEKTKTKSSSGENTPANGARSRKEAAPMPSSTGSVASSGTKFDRGSLAQRVRVKAAETIQSWGLDDDDCDDISNANTACMLNGSLRVERAAFTNVLGLSVKGHENPNNPSYLKSFRAPRVVSEPTKAARAVMEQPRQGRRLGMRGVSVGVFGPMKPLMPVIPPVEEVPTPAAVKVDAAEADAIRKRDEFEPLIVWSQSELTMEEKEKYPDRVWAEHIEVPPAIAKFLRPHQREGVKFMAECVLGLRRFKGNGAILADDMGLGKTLQSISLLYTLLSQGFEQGKPVARRVAIVTPTSLVNNWKAEIAKWLQDKIEAVAVSESSKSDVIDKIKYFLNPRSRASVIIIAYDTFRLHCEQFLRVSGSCDLLICDEAHKLKNAKTGIYESLDRLPCARRILLSGTPLQNNLDEFFAMINFTNRGVLGDRKMFKKYYEMPITAGREPFAGDDEQQCGLERSAELSAIVNQFILRRTNALLSKHLPPKVMQVVCCRPTNLQQALYSHLLSKKDIKRMMRSDGDSAMRTDILPLIGALKQLCNHPKLIYDAIKAKPATGKGKAAKSFTGDEDNTSVSASAISQLFRGTNELFTRAGFDRNPISAMWSGKMYVLERLLLTLRKQTDDRVVIVSNSTSALDVIGEILAVQRWQYLRLDGSTSIKQRQKLVDQLDDRKNQVFCFLLSSRAGGCGLNLVGANRLILFDPDWNPAVDKQAAARVWRDGQTKRCYTYRFLTTGTIEEKVYQRQLSKEGLAEVLGGSMNEAACSSEELRELFKIRAGESASDTHDHLQCDCLDSILTTEDLAKQTLQEMKENQDGNTSSDNADDGEAIQDLPAIENGVDDGADSEDSEVEPDEEPNDDDNDFIVDGDNGDDDEDDFDGAPKSKAVKEASKNKKSKPRRSLKQSLVVDPLKLQSITKAMIGQRGCPPEEELINWAHHITGQSAPDPLFRESQVGMKPTKAGLPYVSFLFSCEVAGKQIGSVEMDDNGVEQENEETRSFHPFSSKCSLPPVEKQTGPSMLISADDALAKHAAMIEAHERKRRKRAGLNSDDEGAAPDARRSLRRSARGSAFYSEDAMAAAQMNGENDAGGIGRGNKRSVVSTFDSALLANGITEDAWSSMTEESRAEALQALQIAQDDEVKPQMKRSKKSKIIEPVPSPPPESQSQQSQSDSQDDGVIDMAITTTDDHGAANGDSDDVVDLSTTQTDPALPARSHHRNHQPAAYSNSHLRPPPPPVHRSSLPSHSYASVQSTTGSLFSSAAARSTPAMNSSAYARPVHQSAVDEHDLEF